ncbi:tetratricopeptide repeat-containing protein [Devosia sp. XK-2]|uniref:tetratricopeptide repeat-containing protein n=1 Tax=Devosia sp. XK-2 TaxID=3126689 RepID=UPI0030CE5AE5
MTQFRATAERAALIFIPGFTGSVAASWQPFITQTLSVPQLASWNILGLDYASKRRVDISGWEKDPSIALLSQYLRTELTVSPLAEFESIAFVAHSMGGLVVQRALVDDPKLAAKVSHVFLYGVPSRGLEPAAMAPWLKQQIGDMVFDGEFVRKLRRDWRRTFGTRQSFELLAIAGDVDDFVGANSSLEPFPESSQRVVVGNHSTLIRPENSDHPSVQILASTLQGQDVPTFIDSARLAVARRNYKAAIERLMPNYASLDDAAFATLAMALDGDGRGDEALRIMDDVYRGGILTTAEAAGNLAGRIKRRWLLERQQADLVRARELYEFGLKTAESENDHAQGFYHAINLAFLMLMASDATADISAVTRRMCQKALDHCAQAQRNHWCIATEGEVALMQGDFGTAESKYREAVAITGDVRDLRSMGDQACMIAFRLGQNRFEQVQGWFTTEAQETRA